MAASPALFAAAALVLESRGVIRRCFSNEAMTWVHHDSDDSLNTQPPSRPHTRTRPRRDTRTQQNACTRAIQYGHLPAWLLQKAQ